MIGVILLAHGSQDSRHAAQIQQIADRVQLPEHVVRVAFLDYNSPTTVDAGQELKDQGCDHLIVVPMLLSRAFHARVDVPREAQQAADVTGLPIAITDPIGPDESFLDFLDIHLPAAVPVVLATAGTSVLDAQQDLEALATLWSERRNAPVVVAYAAIAQPTVTEALANLETDAEHAAIALFFVTDGGLPDRIIDATADLVHTPTLGLSPELIDLIRQRVRSAG